MGLEGKTLGTSCWIQIYKTTPMFE
uniref:Uncharacterized protein n=1 Tax=Rhizophora mucronata TaxID=61149 RepID=A0A2P2NFV4_RHIMU